MEINERLEEQRSNFKRTHHDDLGNTLCGLHFMIQSLGRVKRQDMEEPLAILTAGYERASATLNRLLQGVDDDAKCDSIEELARTAEKDFDIRVHLAGNTLFTW
ncbi:MAG: hypothetical protein ACYCXF_04770 [Thermoleophilia bacterium]